MRKERLLYILLVVLFITYVAVEYYSPKPRDWTPTFSEKDKNPYGSYILYDRLEDFFPEKAMSFQTLYESRDSLDNIFILARQFEPSQADIEALFRMLGNGRSMLISAEVFSGRFLDTLGIGMDYDLMEAARHDSASLELSEIGQVYFPASYSNSSFSPGSLHDKWQVHAKGSGPVLISRNYPKATLVLSATPLAFTNYGLLDGDISRLVARAFRLLPYKSIAYNRYYHSGRSGPSTPLRYLLSQPPMRWAIYLALFLGMLFLVTSSRRVQRVIPLFEGHKNTTIHFIKTLGGLYYREGNHKNSGQKLASHFMKTLSGRYYLHAYNEKTYHLLSSKTGLPVEEVIETFSLIQAVKQADRLSEERLTELYEKINKFNIY